MDDRNKKSKLSVELKAITPTNEEQTYESDATSEVIEFKSNSSSKLNRPYISDDDEEEEALDIRQITIDSMRANRRIVETTTDDPNSGQTSGTNPIPTDVEPLIEYADEPLLPLVKACAPLTSIIHNLSFYVEKALRDTPKKPLDGLTVDESAAIRLYTIEWTRQQQSLYFMLNSTLKSGDRNRLRPYFRYMKLFLTGLVKLPCLSSLTVWRGVTKDLSADFPPGTPVIWWSFSSCTTQLSVLENNLFLGKHGNRTLFSVEAINGRSIRNHSNFDTEDEVLLLPGTSMIVQSQGNTAPGLHIIHLKQIIPERILLKPPFPDACLYPEMNPIVERPWYLMKRWTIPICLFVMLAIIAVVVGAVLGTRSTKNVTSVNNQTVQSSYVVSEYSSQLSSSSKSYCRTGTCSSGQYYYYEATQLSVSTSGYYILKSSSTNGMDTYGYIYRNSFNASAINTSLIQQNNDDGSGSKQFLLNMTLESSIEYIIVVTTYLPLMTGSFTILAVGPGSVNFVHTAVQYTTVYSSMLNGNSSSYSGNGSYLSNSSYYYESIPLTVSTDGYYTIRGNSTLDINGFIYVNSFNPSATNSNLIAEDQNSGGNNQFLLNVSLSSSTPYTIVVTTLTNGVSGPFSIIINGLGSVYFSQSGVVYTYTSSSTLTNASVSYCRVTPCSVGAFYYYESVLLSVSTTGYYTIASASTWDTYGYIYNNTFYSSSPTVNLLQSNDDGGGYYQFQLAVTLEALAPYVLIVTSFSANVIGSFSLFGTGPDAIYFFQTSATYQYTYSSALSSLSSSYCRIAPCSVGSFYYYESIPFSVSATGFYTITSNSTFNTYGYIYYTNFDPSSPSANLFESDNDSGGYGQFEMDAFLQTSVSYVLVVTTFDRLTVGSFYIVGSGPGVARLN